MDPVLLEDLMGILEVNSMVIHREFLENISQDQWEQITRQLNEYIVDKDENHVMLHVSDKRRLHPGDFPRAYYFENWYPEEPWPNIDGSVRWTGGLEATLKLFAPPNIDTLSCQLRLYPAKPKFNGPQDVTFYFGNKECHHIEFSPHPIWYDISLELPGPFHPSGDVLKLVFNRGLILF